MAISAVVCDVEPHLFEIWDVEDVRNTFLVESKSNETEPPLIVRGFGT